MKKEVRDNTIDRLVKKASAIMHTQDIFLGQDKNRERMKDLLEYIVKNFKDDDHRPLAVMRALVYYWHADIDPQDDVYGESYRDFKKLGERVMHRSNFYDERHLAYVVDGLAVELFSRA